MSDIANIVTARATFPETGGLQYTLVWEEAAGRIVHVDAPTPRSVDRMLAVDARVESIVGLPASSARHMARAIRQMGGRIGKWRHLTLSPFVSALYRRGAPVWSENWSADDEDCLAEANAEARGGSAAIRNEDVVATVVLLRQDDGSFRAAAAIEGVVEVVVVNPSGEVLYHDVAVGSAEETNALLPPLLAVPVPSV